MMFSHVPHEFSTAVRCQGGHEQGKIYAILWVSFRYAGTRIITIVSSVDID